MPKRLGVAMVALVVLAFCSSYVEARDRREDFIVHCSNPCDAVIAFIHELGGEVTNKYSNVGAMAISMPSGLRAELEALAGVEAIYEDVFVPSPRPIEAVSAGDKDREIWPQVVAGQKLAELRDAHPNNYVFSNLQTGAATLHSNGYRGDGVIVAVIDTGTANDPVTTPALFDFSAGVSKVIGGEKFVGGASEPSATSTLNHPHGTWVACMIAADVGFVFDNDDPFTPVISAVSKWAPTSVFPVDASSSMVPMQGAAPDARIYAMKVFTASGGGSSSSTVMAAMDRAITLCKNFNDGMPSVPVSGSGSEDDPYVYDSLPIGVVNMSLGGATLKAGRNLMDALTKKMLKAGIVTVISAGNSGPAAMTGGSPGTGIGALTVGAANTPTHERIATEIGLVLGAPAAGDLWRASDHIVTAHFSSRGPTADGRRDPEVVAPGLWVFVNAPLRLSATTVSPNPAVWWVSGTSFSSPTVAGAAALLRGAAPSATATQIRNALVSSADETVLGDNSSAIDQGKGFIDIPQALYLLENTAVRKRLPSIGKTSNKVARNIRKQGYRAITGDAEAIIENLMAGQVKHFFVKTTRRTESLQVTLRNIQPALDPADQNAVLGDGLLVTIVDAPTSFSWLRTQFYVYDDVTIPINKPQEGLVRIAVMGAWINAGPVSAEIQITRQTTTIPMPTAKGPTPRPGVCRMVDVAVPPNVSLLETMLTWKYNWGSYPTNDVDLYIVDPASNTNFAGATLASPERVSISNPATGTWSFFVCGYTINKLYRAKWQLRVTADGIRLTP